MRDHVVLFLSSMGVIAVMIVFFSTGDPGDGGSASVVSMVASGTAPPEALKERFAPRAERSEPVAKVVTVAPPRAAAASRSLALESSEAELLEQVARLQDKLERIESQPKPSVPPNAIALEKEIDLAVAEARTYRTRGEYDPVLQSGLHSNLQRLFAVKNLTSAQNTSLRLAIDQLNQFGVSAALRIAKKGDPDEARRTLIQMRDMKYVTNEQRGLLTRELVALEGERPTGPQTRVEAGGAPHEPERSGTKVEGVAREQGSSPSVGAGPPPAGDSGPPTMHLVVEGETLFSIGQRYDVAVARLRAANQQLLAGTDTIRPGDELQVPSPSAAKGEAPGEGAAPSGGEPSKASASDVESKGRGGGVLAPIRRLFGGDDEKEKSEESSSRETGA